LKRFSQEDNATEYLSMAWIDITPKNIDLEIKASMVRNEIENKTFSISFLSKISPAIIGRFTDYNFYEKNPFL
jgi:hypothetical protein